MARCSTCGNDYDLTFHVTTPAGEELDFDSIECAAVRIAPRCEHCSCTVLGHGVHRGSATYCCDNCARHGENH